MIRILVLKVLKAWNEWKQPTKRYYVLNFYRGETWEIAIIRLRGKPDGKPLCGPVLTERELVRDIETIPTELNSGIWHQGLKHECHLAFVEVMKENLKQRRIEHGFNRTYDIDDF